MEECSSLLELLRSFLQFLKDNVSLMERLSIAETEDYDRFTQSLQEYFLEPGNQELQTRVTVLYQAVRDSVVAKLREELQSLCVLIELVDVSPLDPKYRLAMSRLRLYTTGQPQQLCQWIEEAGFDFSFVKDLESYWVELIGNQSRKRKNQILGPRKPRKRRKRSGLASVDGWQEEECSYEYPHDLFLRFEEEIDLALTETFLSKFKNNGLFREAPVHDILGLDIRSDSSQEFESWEPENEIERSEQDEDELHNLLQASLASKSTVENPFKADKVEVHENSDKESAEAAPVKIVTKLAKPNFSKMPKSKLLEKWVSCNLCKSSMQSIADMRNHIQTDHSQESKSGPQYSFQYQTGTGVPVLGAAALAGLKVYSCSYCPHISNKMSNIKQHLSGVHRDIAHPKSDLRFSLRYKKGYEKDEEKTVAKKCKEMKYTAYHYQECSLCSFSTRWPTALDQHVMSVHQNGPGFRCNDCELEFEEELEFSQHVQMKHKTKMFQCDQCEYYSLQEKALQKHIRFTHQGFRHVCSECSQTFKCPAALRDHTNSMHRGKFYHCDKCEWKGSHRSALQKHFKIKHQKYRIHCEECDHSAKDLSALKKHINAKHKKTWIDCDACSFKGLDNATVYKHKMFCHPLSVYRCTTCDFETEDKENIIQHSRSKHELELDETGGRYFCTSCIYSSRTKGSLTKHTEHTHSSSVYSCLDCGYSTSNPWTLKRHTKHLHQSNNSLTKPHKHKETKPANSSTVPSILPNKPLLAGGTKSLDPPTSS